jgi:hypothetical protein
MTVGVKAREEKNKEKTSYLYQELGLFTLSYTSGLG